MSILTSYTTYSGAIPVTLACLVAYLIGSIPWALVVGQVFYKTDIREHGSGNLGGTNAGRVLGKTAGISVMFLDLMKAFIIVGICATLVPDAAVFAGLACCIGHCFPIFAGFRGGKAVSTCFGYLLAIGVFVTHHPIAMAILPFCIFLLTLKICKMVSLSSMIGIGSAAVISFFVQSNITISLSIVVIWLFVVYRHKDNITRIKNGEEKKISWM